MSDEAPEERKRAADIFTLQEREDGWDDVRSGIKAAIKDRQKPYNQIMEEYVEPAKYYGRFAAVVVEDLVNATGVVMPTAGLTSGGLPSVSLPEVSLPTKESAISAFGDVLDKVGDARSAKSTPPPPPEPVKEARAPANAFLVLGVPAATVITLAAGLVLTSQ